ncbi:hypothetical protein MRB53_039019 [Persea americana]|nr:hypothetical protein MRB53_039019 [Persea americana]
MVAGFQTRLASCLASTSTHRRSKLTFLHRFSLSPKLDPGWRELHISSSPHRKRALTGPAYSVLDARYRLAPEHPYPAAIEDVEDMVDWVRKQPERFDTTKLSISGFSAGACFALATAASFGRDAFNSIIAFYPVTDLSLPPSSKRPPEEGGRPIPRFLARSSIKSLLRHGGSVRDPRVSPSHADAEKFPDRMLMITAGQDNLALEAEALAAKVAALPGRHVVCKRMSGSGAMHLTRLRTMLSTKRRHESKLTLWLWTSCRLEMIYKT